MFKQFFLALTLILSSLSTANAATPTSWEWWGSGGAAPLSCTQPGTDLAWTGACSSRDTPENGLATIHQIRHNGGELKIWVALMGEGSVELETADRKHLAWGADFGPWGTPTGLEVNFKERSPDIYWISVIPKKNRCAFSRNDLRVVK